MQKPVVTVFIAAAICWLMVAFETAEAAQDFVPYSFITYNDENCQGKVVATSPVTSLCKNLPSMSDLYKDNQQEQTNIVSFSYDCRSGIVYGFSDADCTTFSATTFGILAQQSCMKGTGVSYRIVCNGYACQPKPGTTRNNCNKKINRCKNDHSVKMKWTGIGCRNQKGRLIGDGGCQCDGYCGYTCRNACMKDSQCTWSYVDNKCKTKLGNLDGESIPQCTVLL